MRRNVPEVGVLAHLVSDMAKVALATAQPEVMTVEVVAVAPEQAMDMAMLPETSHVAVVQGESLEGEGDDDEGDYSFLRCGVS